jgi:hypothetical protein
LTPNSFGTWADAVTEVLIYKVSKELNWKWVSPIHISKDIFLRGNPTFFPEPHIPSLSIEFPIMPRRLSNMAMEGLQMTAAEEVTSENENSGAPPVDPGGPSQSFSAVVRTYYEHPEGYTTLTSPQ